MDTIPKSEVARVLSEEDEIELRARLAESEAKLAAFHAAALAQDASEGSPPGQYDCYKSWSEIAIDYAGEIQKRIALEAECERLRKRNALLLAVAEASERSADWPSTQDYDYSAVQRALDAAVRALRAGGEHG